MTPRERFCALGEAPEIRGIPGYSKYGASADGRIWRLTKPLSTRYAGWPLPYEIQQSIGATGYLSVIIENDAEKRRKKIKTHRLVALAFYGAPPKGCNVVAHLDGDKTNNAATNLRWATQKENVADKKQHGTSARWRLPPENPSERFRQLGEALYGPLWQSETARHLAVGLRSVQRWASGSHEPPDGVLTTLTDMLREKIERDRKLVTTGAERIRGKTPGRK